MGPVSGLSLSGLVGAIISSGNVLSAADMSGSGCWVMEFELRAGPFDLHSPARALPVI